jgi:hypothetical protein
MKIEILKKLIKANYINVTEAIWLEKNIEVQNYSWDTNISINQISAELYLFLANNKAEIEKKSVEDSLFVLSIMNSLNASNRLTIKDISEVTDEDAEDYDEEEDEYETDMFNPYSKAELEKLKKTEEALIQQGHDRLLNDLLNLIDTKYSMVYNGFNKLEYSRARSQFWKNIGFEGFGTHALSPQGKKFIDDVYNASEPIIKQRVAKRELEILPDVMTKFNSWVKANNHKANKTNLKQYLKENDIKLSNPNIDKILADIK